MLCMAGQESEEIKPKLMVTSTGYWYSSDHQNNPNMMNHQLQSFEHNPEMYNLTSGMEMIGFPPTNNPHVMWKGNFFNKTTSGGPSTSKNEQFYEHGNFTKPDFATSSENMMVSPTDHSSTEAANWHENDRSLLVDDPSLRCVFPCEGNERPSQGLSLSLCSSNPSSIGLQSFELRHPQQDDTRDGFFAKSMNIQQQIGVIQDGFLGKGANMQQQHQGYYHQIRDSKYLSAAQELLNEFCSLGTKQNDHSLSKVLKQQKSNQWQDDQNASTSTKQPLQSLDLLELQKRKTKLLQMLDEVDRRYKHYCDQMKAVVSSFEAVAGNGAATVYSSLASRAMSRHFRCLRDGIVGQIKSTKKAMGEKDTSVPGTTRGETPRLRLLDQTLRQQKAFQQMNMMETHPWRPQRGLPERSVSVLRAWLFEHFLHPYPSDVDKHILARQTGLSRSQVSNWFINARVRLWKPMVEEMYLEETKEQENLGSPDGSKALDDMNGISSTGGLQINQNPQSHIDQDQKPNLARIDSECISSIINNPEKNDHTNNNKSSLQGDHHHHQQQVHNLHHNFGRAGDHQSFGAIELDFSSYNHNSSAGTIAFGNNENVQHNSSGGVSLTLGLNQHNGSHGMGLTFSQAAQTSLFYPRDDDDHIEDCQQVPYSLLDSENQNLPYRNLMGAQLLHDLAG